MVRLFLRRLVFVLGGHTRTISNLLGLSAISARNASRKPVTANLDAQYAVRNGRPTSPENEVIAVRVPLERMRWGKAAYVQ